MSWLASPLRVERQQPPAHLSSVWAEAVIAAIHKDSSYDRLIPSTPLQTQVMLTASDGGVSSHAMSFASPPCRYRFLALPEVAALLDDVLASFSVQ